MPTTLTGLLLFVVLLLPGFAYMIGKERNTPAARRSPFRETVEIASGSVVAGLGALVVLAGARAMWPEDTPDIGAVFRDADTYLDTDYDLVAGWGGWLLVGTTIASGIAGFIAGHRPPHASKISSWREMFESWYPASNVHVKCILDDGTYVEGTMVSYSDSADDIADRDIILKNPIKHRYPGEAESQPFNVGAVCLSARHIVTMFVTHSAEDGSWTTSSLAPSGPEAVADSPAAAMAVGADEPTPHVDFARSPGSVPGPSDESPLEASARGSRPARQPPARVHAPGPDRRPLGPSNPPILVPGADHGD